MLTVTGVFSRTERVLVPTYDADGRCPAHPDSLATRSQRCHPVPENPMNRTRVVQALKLIGTWLPALLLVAIFLPQGWAKFSDASGWAVAFRHWGYPAWFRILIGIVELSAVGCLLSGRWAALGAMMIVTVMLGAMGTHIGFDNGRHLTSEVVPLTLAIIVLVIRRAQSWFQSSQPLTQTTCRSVWAISTRSRCASIT